MKTAKSVPCVFLYQLFFRDIRAHIILRHYKLKSTLSAHLMTLPLKEPLFGIGIIYVGYL